MLEMLQAAGWISLIPVHIWCRYILYLIVSHPDVSILPFGEGGYILQIYWHLLYILGNMPMRCYGLKFHQGLYN
jgi:hypothetical protein